MPLRQFARLLVAANHEPLDEDLDGPIEGGDLPDFLADIDTDDGAVLVD